MRVVGYVRDTPDPSEAEPAFAQAERIRRWISESGHQLVAVCQDVRTAGRPLGRDGYRALIGIVASGEAEGVVLPSLDALSSDKVAQEIMLWDLRSRGVAVVSSEPSDLEQLTDPPADSVRILVRDVLAKVAEHVALVEGAPVGQLPQRAVAGLPAVETIHEPDDSDVVVELIPPAASRDPLQPNRITPAL